VIDGRKVRGDQTRARVLGPAVALATIKGLEGFSLSELSEASGVSKAGIAALFGSKQELQTAIADRARKILQERVLQPVFTAPRGLLRLITLGTRWLNYLADPKLVGGCFFAAASFELDAQPGALRELVRADTKQWIGGIEAMIVDGQSAGEITPTADAKDEAFGFFSIGITANTMIQLRAVPQPADRARRLWAQRVEHLTITSRSPHGLSEAIRKEKP
jgi:AcrR family transcriptional regulator